MRTQTWTCKSGDYAVHIEGKGPPLLLIHGIGPGTSVLANFGALLPVLAEQRTIYGLDLIGFGASVQPGTSARFDFEAWVAQASDAITRINAPDLQLWGQSLGAAVALRASVAHDCVRRIVGTGAGGGARALNPALARFWTTPDSPAQLRDAMAGAVYDASRLSDQQVAQRFATLQAGAGATFRAMMSGDREALLQSCWLPPELLRRLRAEVLLIHGRDDRPVPYRDSALHLADHIDRCNLVLLGRCGHNPLIEQTQQVLRLALDHFNPPHPVNPHDA
jgi:2-hydroxymuconate-semialdehyde hydrolase